MSREGLSLIEVLMAVTVVAILATVAIPSFTNFSKDARKSVTRERMGVIQAAIVGDARLIANGQYLKPGFIAQIGALPDSLDDLVLQGSYSNYDVTTKRGWNGPYVSDVTGWKLDAWGNEIVYSKAGRTLTSWGPDGADDSGADDDIVVSF